MIKINKPPSPQILANNHTTWTQNLLSAITNCNGYRNIPKNEKAALLRHYKHPDIQDALFNCSHRKCAYCECKPEETGNLEVEHFAPKSLYPASTFDWNNLLPACRRCNDAKRDHDTIREPLVNPSIVDPQTYFTFNDLRIVPQSNLTDVNKAIATRTIDVCRLNSSRLYQKRSELLVDITNYLDSLQRFINDLDLPLNSRARHNKLMDLQNSLDTIDTLISDDKLLSAYCKHHILNAPEYNQAKALLSTLEEV